MGGMVMGGEELAVDDVAVLFGWGEGGEAGVPSATRWKFAMSRHMASAPLLSGMQRCYS